MFKSIFLLLACFATTIHAKDVVMVDTIDGPKATGYHGTTAHGSLDPARYEGLAQHSLAELPAKFDWRNTPGALPDVRDQGACGSCWAFAITGALESAEVIQGKRQLQNLSEQHMVSCTTEAAGCGGGYMESAEFVVKTGLTDETSFPYRAANVRCKSGLMIKAKAASYKLLGESRRKPTVDEIKTALIEKGPIFVTVMAGGGGWSGATGAVTSCAKRGSTNHMVQVVAYDDKGWIIKNSWGINWGENGYAHIGYGCDLVGEEAGYVTVNP